MTLEQFEQARQLTDEEFISRCKLDNDFEEEYYSWVDYLTVIRLQQEGKPYEL